MRAGSGSTSVLWAVLARARRRLGAAPGAARLHVDELTRTGLRGAGGLVSLALVLLLALALGGVARQLGTGVYLAGHRRPLPATVFLPLVFLVASAGIAFSTGTSWGTFAIMIPIAVPAAQALGCRPSRSWPRRCPAASSATTPRPSATPPSSPPWPPPPTTSTTSARSCRMR
jgi:tetracycline resistance efflux pump